MNTRQTRILNAIRARHADVRQKIESLIRIKLQEQQFTPTPAFVTDGASPEVVLRELMTKDRARLERERILTVDKDLIAKLHVIATASTSSDLRFIDALNYYYELFCSFTTADVEYSCLFVSFLEEYSQTLATLSKEIVECA